MQLTILIYDNSPTAHLTPLHFIHLSPAWYVTMCQTAMGWPANKGIYKYEQIYTHIDKRSILVLRLSILFYKIYISKTHSLEVSKKRNPALMTIPYLLKKQRSVIVKKVKHGKYENDELQKPEFVLLLQMVQSLARRMQDPDSRQPILHG